MAFTQLEEKRYLFKTRLKNIKFYESQPNKRTVACKYSQNLGDTIGKCFTCVTETIANLATYSRKPENYNGTIIFEFDSMKNSSPINLNLCQT